MAQNFVQNDQNVQIGCPKNKKDFTKLKLSKVFSNENLLCSTNQME